MFAKCFSFISKNKWRFILGIAALIGIGYRLKSNSTTTNVDIPYTSYDYTVQRGSVSNSLTLVGTTQYANAQKLTFANKGRVTSVNVKVGDKVTKGEVLATITTDDLDRDVQSARTNLKNQQLKLNNLLDKSNKELDIIQAQSNYDLLVLKKKKLPSDQALSLQNKESSLEDIERQIKDKEKDLREAQNDYQDLVSGKAGESNADLALSKNVRNKYTTMDKLIRGFRDSAISLQSTIDSYDGVMKLSNTYNGETKSVYIGAKNQNLITQSEEYFWKVRGYIEKLNTLYADFSLKDVAQLTESELLEGYKLYKELGNDMASWGKINYEMFNESIESQGDLTRDTINNYMKIYGTNIENAGYSFIDKYTEAVNSLAELKDSDTTIEDAANKVEKLRIELEQLNISLEKAKNELEIEKTQQSLDSAELDKKIQEAAVDLKKAQEGNSQQQEMDTIRNDIDNIQFQISTLLNKYDEYKIIANFDGVVTKLDMQVGDSIETSNSSSSDQKYIYVETPDLLEVDLSIDQVDIVKVSVGMPVEVYIDAFPDSVYTGYFSEINTMPESSNGYSDGTYSAVAYFQKNNQNENILGGMSASIKAIMSQENDVLIVPNAAISTKSNGDKIVLRKDEKNQWKDQVVKIGLSDDDNTVVLSGLNEGDTIKGVYITEESMVEAGVKQSTQAGFGMGMMGAGMPGGMGGNRGGMGGNRGGMGGTRR